MGCGSYRRFMSKVCHAWLISPGGASHAKLRCGRLAHSGVPMPPIAGRRSNELLTPILSPLTCGTSWLTATTGADVPQISVVLGLTLLIAMAPGQSPVGPKILAHLLDGSGAFRRLCGHWASTLHSAVKVEPARA